MTRSTIENKTSPLWSKIVMENNNIKIISIEKSLSYAYNIFRLSPK